MKYSNLDNIKENKTENLNKGTLNLNVLDSVSLKDKEYLIVKAMKNENNETGFLIANLQELIYVNTSDKLQPVKIDESLKFKILEKIKESFSSLYYSAKKQCNHNIISSEYESAQCRHCNEDFGWYCEESPDHTCHYYSSNREVELTDGSFMPVPQEHNEKYETDDSCIFCGSPEERK